MVLVGVLAWGGSAVLACAIDIQCIEQKGMVKQKQSKEEWTGSMKTKTRYNITPVLMAVQQELWAMVDVLESVHQSNNMSL